MATTNGPDFVQGWLSSALEQTSKWREQKAQEYDDPRNRRSAEALELASRYVLSAHDSIGVGNIRKLVDSCSQEDHAITMAGAWPGDNSERAAGRYFFDEDGSPTFDDHERLFSNLYQEMVEDIREWDGSFVDPNKVLGRLGIRPRPATGIQRTIPVNPPALVASAGEAVAHRASHESDEAGGLAELQEAVAPFAHHPDFKAQNMNSNATVAINDLRLNSRDSGDLVAGWAWTLIASIGRLNESEREGLRLGISLDDDQRQLLGALAARGVL